MKYLITNYYKYLKEEADMMPASASISSNKRKLLKAIYWLSINKGFYGELLSHINVYISLIPRFKTMCTDCETFVACHPEFVQAQPDAVIRAILVHEILHVIGQHNQRKGGRDSDLWNEACDYAINPIIHSDSSFGTDLQFPKLPDGVAMKLGINDYDCLFEERFVGFRAEDIYDMMLAEGRKPGDRKNPGGLDALEEGPIKPGEIEEAIQEPLEPETEDELEAPEDGEKGEKVEKGEKDGLTAAGLTKHTEEGGIAPEEEPGADVRLRRNPDKGDILKGTAKEVTGGAPSKIYTDKGTTKPEWEKLKERAIARNGGTMREETRRLIKTCLGNVPIVDWKTELKKFFDHSLTGRQTVLPNKRLLASGNILYGTKKTGLSTLKTIVAAIDTSGSISEDQQKTFINEVMYLCKKYQADKTIIIYCSDDIDGVDIIKKGGQPDFSKMKTTGGNAKGFIPPFQWVEKNHIKPSVFIYLTDTGGSMPDKLKYGIGKYVSKVIWFICSASMYNTPPFGKILFMPVNTIRPSAGRSAY